MQLIKDLINPTPESEKIVGDILEDTDINDLFDADGKLNKDAVLKAATSKDVDKKILEQYSPENAVDDIFPSGDYKYDADIAAEAYVENNPQMFKNMLYEDLDDRTRSEVYSKVLAVIDAWCLMFDVGACLMDHGSWTKAH